MKEIGADFAMLDDGTLSKQVMKAFSSGITKVLELVGATVIEETSKLLKKNCCTINSFSCAAVRLYKVYGIYLYTKFRNWINIRLYLLLKIFSVCGLKIFMVVNYIHSW